MRKPGIIRCKDCLAWDCVDDGKTFIVGYCNLSPIEPFIQRSPDSYCLKATPREFGTCATCCHFTDDLELVTNNDEAGQHEGICTRTHSFVKCGYGCAHWWPCAESEAGNVP